jgi:5-methylcytosine-specific restriction endonuclease McrA
MKRYRTRKQWWQHHRRQAIKTGAARVDRRYAKRIEEAEIAYSKTQQDFDEIEKKYSFWKLFFAAPDEYLVAKELLNQRKTELARLPQQKWKERKAEERRSLSSYESQREQRRVLANEVAERREEKKEARKIRNAERSKSVRGSQSIVRQARLKESDPQGSGYVNCHYCGKKTPIPHVHLDHKKPVSKGGTNSKQNTVLACAPCNLSKGAKYATSFERWLNKIRGG